MFDNLDSMIESITAQLYPAQERIQRVFNEIQISLHEFADEIEAELTKKAEPVPEDQVKATKPKLNLQDLFFIEPNLGYPTNEPTLYDILVRYYKLAGSDAIANKYAWEYINKLMLEME